MQHVQQRATPMPGMLVVFIVALAVLPGTATAEHQPKSYPEKGTIIAGGLSQHTVNGPPMGSMGSTVQTKFTHTYKIETDSRVFELDCGKLPMWGVTGKACGGPRTLEIGDAVQFRTDKGSAFILLSDGSEQKLRILNEELKPEAKSTDARPPDAKP